jgi:hypothetical protein
MNMGPGYFFVRIRVHDQQISIFSLVLTGRTSRDIATQLNLELIHVERIIRVTRQQLGVRNRQQAALIIAKRHGWPAEQAANHLQAGMQTSHFGSRTGKIAADMVNTTHEQSPRDRYVRDVEGHTFNMVMASGITDEIRIMKSIRTYFNTSQTMQRILQISLILFSSALALSALISAMQGFDVLIQS